MHHFLAKGFVAPIAAVLLILCLPAAVASSVEADVTADRIKTQGTIQGEAHLTALLHPYESSQGASLPTFQLAADRVRVETDYNEVSVVLAAASLNYQFLADTRVDHHQLASLTSQSSGTGYRLHVVPYAASSAKVEFASACAWQESSQIGEITHDPLVQYGDERPDTVIDTSQAIHWEACGDAEAIITGDFWFSAWAIGFEVEDAEGTHAYWSGHRDDEIVTEDQELYVYVTNGTLRLQLGTGYALFLESGGTTEVSGSVQLNNARGSLTTPAGQLDLGGESVTLEGELEFATRRGAEALEVALVGDASGATIDGQSMAFPAPGTRDVPWVWLPGLGVFFVAALVAAWYGSTQWHYHRLRKDGIVQNTYRGRPRRGIVYGHRAEVADKHGRHRRARWWSSLALRSQRGHAAYLRIRAHANAALGRYNAALKDRVLLQELLESRHELADNACQAARMAARIPDAEAAKGWLKAAFDIDGTILLTESMDMAYDDLRKQSWFRSLTSQAEARLRAFN